MREVKTIGDELNGLGMTIKQIMDQNLNSPRTWKKINKLKGSLIVREADTGVAITILFNKGEFKIQNDAIESPSAYLEAGFDALADISSGAVGPIRALLTGRIKARGNLLKLLMVSHVLITREES